MSALLQGIKRTIGEVVVRPAVVIPIKLPRVMTDKEG
jgi:hypothetical protein